MPIPSLAVQIPSAPQIMVQEDSTPEEGEDGPTCEVFDLEDDSSDSASPESDVTSLRIKLKEVSKEGPVHISCVVLYCSQKLGSPLVRCGHRKQ